MRYSAPMAPLRERARRSRRKILAAVAGLAGAVGLLGAPLTAHAAVLTKLPESADDVMKKYAPVYDFDGDGCYMTAAIDASGKLNRGLDLGGDVNGHCRDQAQLDNANTYARAKCNNGWCAILYANYFEKDQVSTGVGEWPGDWNGHIHDWEHVMVWVSEDKVQFVARSVHSDWTVDDASKLRFEGDHVKAVYHKQNGSTHWFRNANESDDAIENPTRRWFAPAIVGWDGFPNQKVRDTLMNKNFGSASIKINDKNFTDALKTVQGKLPRSIPFNPVGPH